MVLLKESTGSVVSFSVGDVMPRITPLSFKRQLGENKMTFSDL